MKDSMSSNLKRNGAFVCSHTRFRYLRFDLLKCAALATVVLAAACERPPGRVSLGEIDMSVAGATLEAEFKSISREGGEFELDFHDWHKETRPAPEELARRLPEPLTDEVPATWPLALRMTIKDEKAGKTIFAGEFREHNLEDLFRRGFHPDAPFSAQLGRPDDGQWVEIMVQEKLRRGRTYLFQMEVLVPDAELGRCEVIFVASE